MVLNGSCCNLCWHPSSKIPRLKACSSPLHQLKSHLQLCLYSAVPVSKKPFREFSQKKRHLLAWSLRAASATENPRVKPDRKQTSKSASAIPYGLQDIDVEDFFAKQKPACRRRDSNDIDVDTLPTLEPYRREVVTQQPITFGHRPLSGSRMFNPSTMDTSFASSSGGLIGGGGGGGRESGVGSRRRRGQAGVRKQYQSRVGSRTKPRRAPGLSAPMLKALLFGNTQPGGREPKAISLTASTKNVIAQSDSLEFPVRDGEFKLDSAGERRLVQDPDDECSGEDSNWNMWRSVDPAGGGMRGNLDATWLTSSSRGDLRQGKGVHKGGLLEDKELERIFSVNVSLKEAIWHLIPVGCCKAPYRYSIRDLCNMMGLYSCPFI